MKKIYTVALSLLFSACVHGDGTITDPLPSWGEVYTKASHCEDGSILVVRGI